MKNLSLKNIAKVCGGKLYCSDETIADTEVTSIVSDSRKIEKGGLFVAIKGNVVDGHDYIESAYAQGVMAVMSQKELDTEQPYILIDDPYIAVKKLAKFYREGLDIKVVGVTGSVGKTSTKEMIYSVLNEKYNTLKTDGNFNNELGLPLTVFRIRDEHEIAVLEMGISDFGEMTRLTEIAKPDVAVITNVGFCHLEKLGTRDGVLKAKTEIFNSLAKDGKIILNGDDDKLATVSEYNGIKPVFFHVSENSDSSSNNVYADQIKTDGVKGVYATLHYNDSVIDVKINIPGIHMVYNALAALCVGKAFGLSDDEIKAGIEKVAPLEGRNNIVEKDNVILINGCYNANPMSMKASIDVLSYADTRKVAILGDMFELGENEKEMHKEIGEYLADTDVDVIVLCGKLMNNAYTYLLENASDKKLYYFDRLKELLTELDRILQDDDTVLIKASHGMEFAKIIQYIR
ncbi:MAG: UDP-N-acetylmuramoyl-tripeptide--D-alanyl-D-alanine ligase [Lachnospiraceae bacterium]|nr:UDP-N-acetylmuramoyl-tripeptide--D-alanyl-D-alanine ligase [Lachnospiraceae bacterium]